MPIYQATKPQHETKDITDYYDEIMSSRHGNVEITNVTMIIFHRSNGKYAHSKIYGEIEGKKVFAIREYCYSLDIPVLIRKTDFEYVKD